MMRLGTAISTCMEKFVTFSGRASRAEYWWFILFTTLLAVIGSLLHPKLYDFVTLTFLVPTLAVGWRRMHDIGRPGALVLLPLVGVPLTTLGVMTGMAKLVTIGCGIIILSGLYCMVLMIISGDIGANKYGDDPHRPDFDIKAIG